MALGLVLLAHLLAMPALATEQGMIAADAARALAQQGRITIVDIRRPDEWRQTGLPEGARRATVLPGRGAGRFLARIAELTNGDKSKPIALICAAGVRSRHASGLLRARGYTNVLEIREGMLGNRHGAGWLKRSLPLVTCGRC
ncbi:MAG: rhodanese-like domain-containing protein [Alphaproteobacteria bacterium]|nr:rhodanese-like domain-containing protein [Alphaproteobacteria bacterium]MDP6812645.1 rhodanese-like domain-containing protein [Alphaproteobacteria bacterium]